LENQKQFEPSLVMYRPTLLELPSLEIPDGYTLRSFQAGDESYWEAIIDQSFKYESNFQKEIISKEQYKPEKVLFICSEGIPVATATAWYQSIWGEHAGYLHMVGALPSHTGKGLGLQVSLAAMHEMRKEGRMTTVLNTDDFRIPAIKTYLKLGYRPLIIHENQGKRWEEILSNNSIHV